jgi:hypothetical protein
VPTGRLQNGAVLLDGLHAFVTEALGHATLSAKRIRRDGVHLANSEQAAFVFLRSRPRGPTAASLTSCLQTLETTFILIALLRYPHALTSCAFAIESIIKASPSCKTNKQGLKALLDAAERNVTFIRTACPEDLRAFRDTRNRIVHEGFSPKDDSESTGLIIRVGFPLAFACLNDLHQFDFPDSVLQEYAEQLSAAEKVYRRASSVSKDFTYCLKSFGHLVRWNLRGNFSEHWAGEALTSAEESGHKFDIVHSQKGEIERQFGAFWDFDCPICEDIQSAVTELSESGLDDAQVRPLRLACVNCGLSIGKDDHFLAEVILEPQIMKTKRQILKEYGIVVDPEQDKVT